MVSRKTSIERQFNHSAAGLYDANAHVQSIMADKLAKSVLKSVLRRTSEGDSNRPNILEIGCGTGNLTEILVKEWPSSSITALDVAPAMILAAEQRVRSHYFSSSNQPVNFLLEDIEIWAADAPASSFDLIVSNACFQWLSHPKQTLEHLRKLLRTEGLLTFATFGPDTFRELHASFDEVYRAEGVVPERHGLSFQSVDEWNDLLRKAGFSSIQNERVLHTKEYASARDFLLSVKALGASTSEATTSSSIGLRRLFTNMYKEYEDKFSTPNGVFATYDVLFIQASGT